MPPPQSSHHCDGSYDDDHASKRDQQCLHLSSAFDMSFDMSIGLDRSVFLWLERFTPQDHSYLVDVLAGAIKDEWA